MSHQLQVAHVVNVHPAEALMRLCQTAFLCREQKSLRVVAFADAHKKGARTAIWHGIRVLYGCTESCHGVWGVSPQDVQIRHVRIRSEVEAAKAAVETFLQCGGAGRHHEEPGRTPSLCE